MWEFFVQHWRSGVEILILAMLIYHGYVLIQGTRSAQILAGLVAVLLTLTLLSEILQLEVIGWLLRSFSVFLALGLVVIFQKELRDALAELGTPRLFKTVSVEEEWIDQVVESLSVLANRRHGALVVLERSMKMSGDQLSNEGVELDASFSKELMLAIFYDKGPIHDGGVVLRKQRIHSAATMFHVTQRELSDRTLGLRHRAALGVSENSDAVALVASEETGSLALAFKGELMRPLTPDQMKQRLIELLSDGQMEPESTDESGD